MKVSRESATLSFGGSIHPGLQPPDNSTRYTLPTPLPDTRSAQQQQQQRRTHADSCEIAISSFFFANICSDRHFHLRVSGSHALLSGVAGYRMLSAIPTTFLRRRVSLTDPNPDD